MTSGDVDAGSLQYTIKRTIPIIRKVRRTSGPISIIRVFTRDVSVGDSDTTLFLLIYLENFRGTPNLSIRSMGCDLKMRDEENTV